MVLHILRALFVLLMAAVGWFFLKHTAQPFGAYTWMAMSITLTLAVLFICIDILSPRKKLAIFSGTILGLLVGLFTAYALSFVVDMVVDQYVTRLPEPPRSDASTAEHTRYASLKERRDTVILFANVVVGMVCCYLAISFILQTKDDFRFIVPYVEFSKQVRGARPIVVDTSAIIDGRLLELADTGVLESRLIVPRFVLHELQLVADHGDKLKRNRGRRGLDVLNKLQSNRKVEVILYDWTGHASPEETEDTDQKLLALSKELNGRLMTTDFNLSKVAQVRGVDVINVNELAGALRPTVLPGERLHVKLVKPGEDPSQGIGFLDDGTMVVVEHGRPHLNSDVELTVTNVLQTSSGRMIFGRLAGGPPAPMPEPVAQGPAGGRRRGHREDRDGA
jgi:uncharacterized protein YacL